MMQARARGGGRAGRSRERREPGGETRPGVMQAGGTRPACDLVSAALRDLISPPGPRTSFSRPLFTLAPAPAMYKFEGLLEFHGEGFLKILPFKMKGYLKNRLSQKY